MQIGNLKPRIVRAWNPLDGSFLWVVSNELPRSTWTNHTTPQERRMWQLAWRFINQLNMKEASK